MYKASSITLAKMVEDFDPNAIRKRDFSWATYIPNRNPEFKIHSGSGPAKNAFYEHEYGILYRKDGITGKWVEVFRVVNGDYPICQHGGYPSKASWKKWDNLKWIGKGNYSRLVSLCENCARGVTIP